jgi:predicted XRE-type DNA-binding protein
VPTPDPVPPLKQVLARAIVEALDGWLQEWAAELLRTDQPRMSDLRAGRLERFSLQQLVRFVARIGGEVTITIRWTSKRYLRLR